MGRIRRRFQQLRVLTNYFNEGRRCGNCTHYEPSIYPQPSFGTEPPMPYTPEMCGKHGFRVSKNAICDDWEHKDG